MTHEQAAELYSKLSEASKVGNSVIKFSSFQEAEEQQRFINALCSATGLWYDTTIERDTNVLVIKARK